MMMMERMACIYLNILALFLVQSLIPNSAKNTLNITTDQFALLEFKSLITSDPSKTISRNWSTAFPICDWIGVTCDSVLHHHRVTALNISSMNLTGTISPHLGNLSFLVSLDLSANKFHGSLPHDLSHLHRLKFLDCGINNLNGELPSWLGTLSNLRYLSMRNNSFSGLIPPSISNISNLEQLFLSFNSIKGRFPVEIGNLNNLKEMAVNYNELSGPLPIEIFNISSLERLSLLGNKISGNLPHTMCDRLRRLWWLNLSVNNFHGPIPSNFSQCSELQVLSLSVNNFSGSIPKEIGNLKQLVLVYIGENGFTGMIPKEIANLTMVQILSIPKTNLTGEIPPELSNLKEMEELSLSSNSLSGSIPVGIFNISTLGLLSFENNHIQGNLPTSIGYRQLPALQFLHLRMNNLTGFIPNSITNLSQLIVLDLGQNQFSGLVPSSLGNLRFIQRLDLSFNPLSTSDQSSNQELGFITSLMNCRNLRVLAICGNQFNGNLPDSIGNLSTTVERFYAYMSNIRGSIPEGIGNLSSLFVLSLYGNALTGTAPETLGGLQNLDGLYLNNNELTGEIPKFLCDSQIVDVSLHENQFSGSIPECLGNATSFRYLDLNSNKLNSTIPANLWNLKDLLELNLSSNSLIGSLPAEIGNLIAATTIDLSMNDLSGELPSIFERLQSLDFFSLANNKLKGSIPESISEIPSLERLDLSHNNFTGLIPISFEKLQSLKYLDVSFNNLSGKIPSGGPFENFTSESFVFNDALCGPQRFHVAPCPANSSSSHNSRTKRVRQTIFMCIGIINAIVGLLAVGLVYLRCRKKVIASRGDGLSIQGAPERISYYELLHATEGYNERNLLGSGGYGSVYKGTLNDGRIVAIKVFNLQLEGAFKSFDAECEALRNLRHRNLAKVIGSCSNPDFKALVLEFMPNGSLEKWLYSDESILDLKQRLSIMLDVAIALQYLHSGGSTPIVHCDLKPSNVLLDQEMVAHVSDFGIAKLLNQESSFTHTATIATLGYIAPEYGLEGLISTKCDVYSYGIMLMEVFTSIRPSDERFNGNFSLKDLVHNSTADDALYKVVDSNLLQEGDEHFAKKLESISSIMEIALNCSTESSRERSNMDQVVIALSNVKTKLLSIGGF